MQTFKTILGGFVMGLSVTVLLFIYGLFNTYLSANVLIDLWDSFFIPAGYAPLTLRTAIGYGLFVSLMMIGTVLSLMRQLPKKTENKDETFLQAIGSALTASFGITIATGITWLVIQFWDWYLG